MPDVLHVPPHTEGLTEDQEGDIGLMGLCALAAGDDVMTGLCARALDPNITASQRDWARVMLLAALDHLRSLSPPAPTITAKITARGPRSTVPGNTSAVDATVYVDGRDVGDCTLLPRQYDGRLDVWGAIDHWADDSLRAALDAGTLSADDVVEAVIAADR